MGKKGDIFSFFRELNSRDVWMRLIDAPRYGLKVYGNAVHSDFNQANAGGFFFHGSNRWMIREVVLGRLYGLVKDFVKRMGVKRGLSESLAAEAGGTIFSFGSYRLGVHGTGADIDTLCVVPRHVTREDFFSHLYEMVKEFPEVTELAVRIFRTLEICIVPRK
jgi:poly(A) polymerase Pap1